MYASRILRTLATTSTTTLPHALSELIPKDAANVISNKPRTLYETLSRLPHDGVGARVHQARWSSKGIEGCYWEVSRVKLKDEGKHGKAWGRLVWRGAVFSLFWFRLWFSVIMFSGFRFITSPL